MRNSLYLSLFIFIIYPSVLLHHLHADTVIADMDQHLVEVNTGFTGSDILLFGAISGDKDAELIVIIKGPRRNMIIKRKESNFGIWLEADQVKLNNIHSFYYYAITSPAALDLVESVRNRHRIGLENLYFPTIQGMDAGIADAFIQGLTKYKIDNGSYHLKPGRVERRGENLFRLKFHMPGNAPVGAYSVETLMVKDGKIVSAQTTPLFVSKIGLNSFIYYMANSYPIFFGLFAVFLACLIGYGFKAFLNLTKR